MGSVTEEQAKGLVDLVRYKVRAFTQGRPSSDTDDLVQEVVVRVLERLVRFDPTKASLLTYQNRLIDRACADYHRRQRAAKRGRGRAACSLDQHSHHGRGLHEVLDAEQQAIALGKRSRSDRVLHDLRLDLQSASSHLSASEQRLCEQIKQKPVTEVARDENVVRGTIYRRLKPVRKVFENHDLAGYLE